MIEENEIPKKNDIPNENSAQKAPQHFDEIRKRICSILSDDKTTLIVPAGDSKISIPLPRSIARRYSRTQEPTETIKLYEEWAKMSDDHVFEPSIFETVLQAILDPPNPPPEDYDIFVWNMAEMLFDDESIYPNENILEYYLTRIVAAKHEIATVSDDTNLVQRNRWIDGVLQMLIQKDFVVSETMKDEEKKTKDLLFDSLINIGRKYLVLVAECAGCGKEWSTYAKSATTLAKRIEDRTYEMRSKKH